MVADVPPHAFAVWKKPFLTSSEDMIGESDGEAEIAAGDAGGQGVNILYRVRFQ